jgi:hypothetical protein
MIAFLRRPFGHSQPSLYAKETVEGDVYDADTQEMILFSFDLLERMGDKGDSLDEEWLIGHFFSGEVENIRRAAGLFQSWGFYIGVQEECRLQITERNYLSVAWVETTIPMMCRTAGEFELNYDGWDCERGKDLDPGEIHR